MQNNQYNQYNPYNPYQSSNTPNNYQQPYQNQFNNDLGKDYNIGMVFNTIYSIILLVFSAMCLTDVFIFFFSDLIGIAIILLFVMAFNIVTGILLLKRKRAGNIMRLIGNLCSLIGSILFMLCNVLIAILLLVGGSGLMGSSEYGEIGLVFVGIGIWIIIAFAITSIISIVVNIVIMRYYRKRKHMFN